jgi:hypothetical protein
MHEMIFPHDEYLYLAVRALSALLTYFCFCLAVKSSQAEMMHKPPRKWKAFWLQICGVVSVVCGLVLLAVSTFIRGTPERFTREFVTAWYIGWCVVPVCLYLFPSFVASVWREWKETRRVS